MNDKSAYEILGINVGASWQEVQSTFRMKAKEFHSDTTKRDTELAKRRFKEINAAYAYLRQKLDSKRPRGEAPTSLSERVILDMLKQLNTVRLFGNLEQALKGTQRVILRQKEIDPPTANSILAAFPNISEALQVSKNIKNAKTEAQILILFNQLKSQSFSPRLKQEEWVKTIDRCQEDFLQQYQAEKHNQEQTTQLLTTSEKESTTKAQQPKQESDKQRAQRDSEQQIKKQEFLRQQQERQQLIEREKRKVEATQQWKRVFNEVSYAGFARAITKWRQEYLDVAELVFPASDVDSDLATLTRFAQLNEKGIRRGFWKMATYEQSTAQEQFEGIKNPELRARCLRMYQEAMKKKYEDQNPRQPEELVKSVNDVIAYLRDDIGDYPMFIIYVRNENGMLQEQKISGSESAKRLQQIHVDVFSPDFDYDGYVRNDNRILWHRLIEKPEYVLKSTGKVARAPVHEGYWDRYTMESSMLEKEWVGFWWDRIHKAGSLEEALECLKRISYPDADRLLNPRRGLYDPEVSLTSSALNRIRSYRDDLKGMTAVLERRKLKNNREYRIAKLQELGIKDATVAWRIADLLVEDLG